MPLVVLTRTSKSFHRAGSNPLTRILQKKVGAQESRVKRSKWVGSKRFIQDRH